MKQNWKFQFFFFGGGGLGWVGGGAQSNKEMLSEWGMIILHSNTFSLRFLKICVHN